ncbi:MAG: TetR/AcrR family transcriptional regulator [Roseburia sp.]|nr:TetR/AcrR family transcriptional regulator [Roseburia sp.]
MPLKSDKEKQMQKKYLLEIGKKLMLQYGIKKTTVDDIVAEAKIAKGTFYLYFKSKEDFFYQLLVAINQNLFRLAEETVLKNLDKDIKSTIQKFLENLFDTPEIGFYFREHKEIDKLTEKFSAENYADTETGWIRKLLDFGNINTEKVIPEVIDNYIHVINLAKSSDLLIEEYREETVSRLIADLVDYIFMEDNQNE